MTKHVNPQEDKPPFVPADEVDAEVVEPAPADEDSDDDSMDRFANWFAGVHQYATDVAKDLENHPDPEAYFKQMDALITES